MTTLRVPSLDAVVRGRFLWPLLLCAACGSTEKAARSTPPPAPKAAVDAGARPAPCPEVVRFCRQDVPRTTRRLACDDLVTESDLACFDHLEEVALTGRCYGITELTVSRLGQLRKAELGFLDRSLKVLAPLRRLEELTVSGGWVRDLAALGGLRALRKVRIDATLQQAATERLKPLCELPSLVELRLSEAPTDVGSLACLRTLRVLHLDFRGGVTLSLRKVAPLTALETLDLRGAMIHDLEGLGALTQLTALSLQRLASETSLVPLARLTSLTSLHLVGGVGGVATGIGSAPGAQRPAARTRKPRAQLPSGLKRLHLEHVSLDDLRSLERLPELEELTLIGDSNDDLGPIARLPRLTRLRIVGSSVDVRPLLKASTLTEVHLEADSYLGLDELRRHLVHAKLTVLEGGRLRR